MNPHTLPHPVPVYQPLRACESHFLAVRGLRYHVRVWEPDPSRPSAGQLILLHGWMDVSASFQFLVDALAGNWRVLAPDWRGYGLTDRPAADCYWFPDYLADLDELLRQLAGDSPVDLIAHSMGGNVAMLYAGIRPGRVRRLVNLEGLGLRSTPAEQAPERYAQWLDELATGMRMRDYASHDEVAERLCRTNPRLTADKARFLARHWSAPAGPSQRLAIQGDPAHKLVNPVLYRVDEVLACWRRIEAPLLMVLSDRTDGRHAFAHGDEFRQRLAAVPRSELSTLAQAGHMLHHDRPAELAQLIESFLARHPIAVDPVDVDRAA